MKKYLVKSASILKDNVFVSYDSKGTYLGQVRVADLWISAVGTPLSIQFEVSTYFLGKLISTKDTIFIFSRDKWYSPSVSKDGTRYLKRVSTTSQINLDKALLEYRTIKENDNR